MEKLNIFSKSTKLQKSLFYQYLILYVITAFLPVALASVSLFFSYKALKQEIISSNQSATALVKDTFDTKLTELDSVLQQIAQEGALTQYHLQEDPSEAVKCLERFVSLQDCLDNIVITSRNGNCLYTASGVIRDYDVKYHSFVNDYVQSGSSPEEWINVLRQADHKIYVSVNNKINKPQYLYLFSPVYTNFLYDGSATNRSVALIINQNFIHDLFRSSQTTKEENILLLDSDFNLLSYFSQSLPQTDILSICEKLKEYNYDSENMYFESGDGNIFFISHSIESGLYYVRFLPTDIAYQSLQVIKTYTILILILVSIIGILLIILGMKRNFLPIHDLAKSILDQTSETSRYANELELFKQTYKDNVALSQTISHSKQSIINHFLAVLVQGNFNTEEAFQNACKNIGIDFNLSYYCVCCILIESDIVIKI